MNTQFKHMDEIEYIRKGGHGRYGKIPDKIVKVYFLRLEKDGQFSYLYSKDNDQVGYSNVENIITVNGVAV